jgi:hypothetical protein
MGIANQRPTPETTVIRGLGSGRLLVMPARLMWSKASGWSREWDLEQEFATKEAREVARGGAVRRCYAARHP